MKVICKECGSTSTNGTNFCSHKCKKLWVKAHNYTKEDWKHINARNELVLIRSCRTLDAEDLGQS